MKLARSSVVMEQFCCQKEYEDHVPTQLGMLCVRAPHAGVGCLDALPLGAGLYFDYLDLLVAVAVFTAVLLMLAIGLV